MTLPRPSRSWVGPLLLLAFAALALGACGAGTLASAAPSLAPGVTAGPTVTPSPTPLPTPLHPAPLGADPFSLLAWAFTPIFQVAFLILVAFYKVVGDIGIAIVLLTIVIRLPLIPLFRRQIVSMRSTQLLAPQVKEIQRRYKGERQKIFDETQALYRSHGISQFSGCLPILLQMPLLFVMYQVIREGLTAYDITPMLTIAGQKLIPISCPDLTVVNKLVQPCIHTTVAWLGGIDVGQPHVDLTIPILGFGLGISVVAILSAVLQIFQSRMTLPPLDKSNPDPNARIQRQTMLFLPLIFILYANILPAGLYIYYIASTIISIIQQYLIVGWGSTFPLFGWNPAFAQGHTPRFPVATPAPTQSTRATGAPARPTDKDRAASAASTVRSRERGRQGRRGRRR